MIDITNFNIKDLKKFIDENKITKIQLEIYEGKCFLICEDP